MLVEELSVSRKERLVDSWVKAEEAVLACPIWSKYK